MSKFEKYLYSLYDVFRHDPQTSSAFERAQKIAAKNNGFSSKNHFPCPICDGKSYKKVACGPYDYDEKACNFCAAKGYVEKTTLKDAFKTYENERKLKAEREKEKNKKLKEIKKKLTKEELTFLLNNQ
jgi:transcriptional antiterminator Rof (Rho-off)